ncbi:MAG: hypothetical protein HQK53_06745, partial [Oligoflexia bacterium]|nr:hypothetical protein [Oligoflexia bacterium]
VTNKNSSVTSFYQAVVSLKQITKNISEKFAKFPLEEDEGIASSGFSGRGPRYRGKIFIVEGGYDKINNTVAQNFKNQTLANEVDSIIQSSGMDFSLSFESKINRLISNYETSVTSQKKQVEERIQELNKLVKNSNSYLPRFLSMSFIEYYDLNRI